MSEENTNGESTSGNAPASSSFDDKIAQGIGKIDSVVNKMLGLIGDHPWTKWLAVGNKYIDRYLPLVIALAGVTSFIVSLITAIRFNAPISAIFSCLGVLLVTAFSVHLTPKALALLRSAVEKSEPENMRPELLYICKVVLGLGGIVASLILFFQFNADMAVYAIVLLVIALVSIIIFANPLMAGIKEGYPKNTAEELFTILVFPVRVVISLFTTILAIAVIGGYIYGIIVLFDSALAGVTVLNETVLIPLLLPLAVYFGYLVVMFLLEICRAVVAIPRKLDEVRDAVSKK